MSGESSMIFFPFSDFTLGDAADVLMKRNMSVSRRGDTLTVKWASGPAFFIELDDKDYVFAEAWEIGEGTPHLAGMTMCHARFEITFENLDEVLDEMNSLIE